MFFVVGQKSNRSTDNREDNRTITPLVDFSVIKTIPTTIASAQGLTPDARNVVKLREPLKAKSTKSIL